MKRIYVGNIDYGVSEESIKALFEPFGEIDTIAFIKDKDTGRFRGFCFIRMEDDCAAKAIEKLQGIKIAGRVLDIKPANLKKRRKSNKEVHK